MAAARAIAREDTLFIAAASRLPVGVASSAAALSAPGQQRDPGDDAARGGDDAGGGTFQEMKARRIAAMEKTYVEELLTKHAGNVTHCSEEAGMARSAFQKLMQKHGVRSADFRA